MTANLLSLQEVVGFVSAFSDIFAIAPEADEDCFWSALRGLPNLSPDLYRCGMGRLRCGFARWKCRNVLKVPVVAGAEVYVCWQ